MRTWRTLVACAALALVVVVGSALHGAARFGEVRWSPPPPGSRSPPKALPTAEPLTVTAVELRDGTGNGAFWRTLLVIAVVLAVVVLAVLVWRAASGRRVPNGPSPDAVTELEPVPDVPVVRSGLEEALRLLDVEREPGDAVMKAWLGLQRTAEESGILRRPAETATEFTTRIMSLVAADDRAVRTLLTLYLRTRFGDHPVTPADVARARQALEGLARSWDAGTAGQAPTTAGSRTAIDGR